MSECFHAWQAVRIEEDGIYPYTKIVCRICGFSPLCLTWDGRPFRADGDGIYFLHFK